MVCDKKMGARTVSGQRLTRTVRVPRVIALATLPERRGAALILEYVKMETMSTEEQRKVGCGEELAMSAPQELGALSPYGARSCQLVDEPCHPVKHLVRRVAADQRLGRRLVQLLIQAQAGPTGRDDPGEARGSRGSHQGVETQGEPSREDLEITPSLLHGNLWSRNWGVDYSGKPVIYDPAVYFGHYEMEMSMLTMFGSPCKGFFVRYHDLLPREEPGYQDRIMLYQLYHYLNLYLQHGRGFRSPCMALVKTLLAPSIPSGSSSG
ncbi:unnamed protein product [Ectocarpus sp. CCAP 1310/34]|nr:unnamed protein product [Ectocarpus sp. CCAP 1310/34]